MLFGSCTLNNSQDIWVYQRRLLRKDQKPCVRILCCLKQYGSSQLTICDSIGAIERAKREDENFKLSYQALVEELDVGDSFSTQLIEVFVKVCLNYDLHGGGVMGSLTSQLVPILDT